MGLQLALAAETGTAPVAATAVDYLPFGVQTVRLTLSGDYAGEVRVRPQRMAPLPATYAHEDGAAPPQLILSWGGGHERYLALQYPAQRLLHFLVWHSGSGSGDYPVTFEARDEDGRLLTTIRLTLTFPRLGGERWQADALHRGVWQEVVGGLDGSADLQLTGTAVPLYQPRWWPARQIIYGLDPPPAIRLRLRRRTAGGFGDVRLFATGAEGQERLLAVIDGQIDPVLYDTRHICAQLYRFGRRYWVVRLWFFWLKLAYSVEDVACCWPRSAAERAAAWQATVPVSAGGTAVAPWAERHEVPDAERVDILFDDASEPLFVATDLHWRELWGQLTARPPVEAEIMNTRARALAANWQQVNRVVRGWGAIVLSRLAGNRPPYQPHREVAAELAGASTLGADPIALESHSPAFLNVTLQTRWTSTHVADG